MTYVLSCSQQRKRCQHHHSRRPRRTGIRRGLAHRTRLEITSMHTHATAVLDRPAEATVPAEALLSALDVGAYALDLEPAKGTDDAAKALTPRNEDVRDLTYGELAVALNASGTTYAAPATSTPFSLMSASRPTPWPNTPTCGTAIRRPSAATTPPIASSAPAPFPLVRPAIPVPWLLRCPGAASDCHNGYLRPRMRCPEAGGIYRWRHLLAGLPSVGTPARHHRHVRSSHPADRPDRGH